MHNYDVGVAVLSIGRLQQQVGGVVSRVYDENGFRRGLVLDIDATMFSQSRAYFTN